MRKGFTLVEVLAVIVVLGLLVAIISPVVNNLLADSEDALSDKQVDSIVKASKKYMVEHSELLPENSDSTAIYISDLIDNGVIDNDEVIDPKTKAQMNGCVVVNYNENFNQYEYNYRDDCSINITFDPEGGSVDTTSKQVMIGKTYGDLPTPTREGYRFLGWSGKNMFSQNLIMSKAYIVLDGNNVIFDATKVSGNEARNNIQVWKIGDTVTWLKTTRNLGLFQLVYERDNNFNDLRIKLDTSKADARIEIITDGLENGKKYSLSFNVDIIDSSKPYAIISNIQIEKGEVATSYEPYQEFTSDAIVDKSSDYTMHAIWEVAS